MDKQRIVTLPISRLVTELGYQPRYLRGSDGEEVLTNPRHVRALMVSRVEDWPPIRVVQGEQPDTYTVIDGFHRVEAARRLGLATIRAEVLDGEADYSIAFEYNAKNGLPLSTEDRKAFARFLHKQNPELSWREIGRRTGLNDETVKAACTGRPKNRKSTPRYSAEQPTGSEPLTAFFEWATQRQGVPIEDAAEELAQTARELWGEGAGKNMAMFAKVVSEASARLSE